MAARAKLLVQVGAVTLVALLLALLVWRVVTTEKAQGLAGQVAAGEAPRAPDFELPRLSGEGTVRLSALRGKAVVINFWASWCEPCEDEAPHLEAAWRSWKERGVVVLGVDAQDFRTDARRFVERFGISYPIVHDGRGSTLGRFGVTGFPETWFVDRDGRLVERVQGPVDAEGLERGIEAALAS